MSVGLTAYLNDSKQLLYLGFNLYKPKAYFK